MRIFSIGFTKKSAESFFSILQSAGVRRILDVRLNNVSQLAGFAKKNDLSFFLKTICSIDYDHRPELAPTKEILDAFKKGRIAWEDYKKQFRALLASRRVEQALTREEMEGTCFLCSEATPHRCHRRLVAEYLMEKWDALEITHL